MSRCCWIKDEYHTAGNALLFDWVETIASGRRERRRGGDRRKLSMTENAVRQAL